MSGRSESESESEGATVDSRESRRSESEFRGTESECAADDGATFSEPSPESGRAAVDGSNSSSEISSAVGDGSTQ